jgi:hypothetical protein
MLKAKKIQQTRGTRRLSAIFSIPGKPSDRGSVKKALPLPAEDTYEKQKQL